MTDQTADASSGKPVKEFWHALLLIVPITFGWLWFLIKNVNLPHEKKSELFWDMNAKNMDRFAENEGLKKFESRRNEKLRKYLKGSDTVLDYGCGTGTIAIQCAGTVKEVRGIDYAPGMIEAAQRKAAESGVDNARFMQATIFDDRLKKGSFDVVLAWGILHLVDDRPVVIKRIHELLEPGGLLISATECMAEKRSSVPTLLSFLMKIGIFPIGLKLFTVSELEGSVTRAGFQVVEKELFADNPVSCFIAAENMEKKSGS
jgi:2-polyprenyl-3-methyl-5-hydroxy-6-metoxy-1,4-benzoquinol methylase